MREELNILIVGDVGVGKSSLASSYVSRNFSEYVPGVVTTAVLPKNASASRVSVTIVDSSSRPNDREDLRQKLEVADSVIALYDVTRLDTLDNLIQDWLPLIVDIQDNGARVVIAGTKIDMLGEIDEVRVQEENEKLILAQSEFNCIKSCCRCSAKLLNVDEVFHWAELAINFPLDPLFDRISGSWTDDCLRALRRVFRILDNDHDDLLADGEMQSLQFKCFGDILDEEDVSSIKREIQANIGLNGIKNDKITFSGFCSFMELFIARSRLQVPWMIFRRFGFDEDLDIVLPTFPVIKEGIRELSDGALKFLRDMAFVESRVTQGEESELSMLLAAGERERQRQKNDTKNNMEKSDATKNNNNNNSSNYNESCEIDNINNFDDFEWQGILRVYDILGDVSHPWSEDNGALLCDEDGELLLSGQSKMMKLGGVNNNNNSGSSSSSGILESPHKNKTHNHNYEKNGSIRSTERVWLNHWHLLTSERPELAQTLLHMLGYIERPDQGIVIHPPLSFSDYPDFGTKRRKELHIALLGPCETLKRKVLLQWMISHCDLHTGDACQLLAASERKPLSVSFCLQELDIVQVVGRAGAWGAEGCLVIIATSVPEIVEVEYMQTHGTNLDVAMMLFDSSSSTSNSDSDSTPTFTFPTTTQTSSSSRTVSDGLESCLRTEEWLPDELPRALIGIIDGGKSSNNDYNKYKYHTNTGGFDPETHTPELPSSPTNVKNTALSARDNDLSSLKIDMNNNTIDTSIKTRAQAYLTNQEMPALVELNLQLCEAPSIVARSALGSGLGVGVLKASSPLSTLNMDASFVTTSTASANDNNSSNSSKPSGTNSTSNTPNKTLNKIASRYMNEASTEFTNDSEKLLALSIQAAVKGRHAIPCRIRRSGLPSIFFQITGSILGATTAGFMIYLYASKDGKTHFDNIARNISSSISEMYVSTANYITKSLHSIYSMLPHSPKMAIVGATP